MDILERFSVALFLSSMIKWVPEKKFVETAKCYVGFTSERKGTLLGYLRLFRFLFSPAHFCSEEISEKRDQRSDVKTN